MDNARKLLPVSLALGLVLFGPRPELLAQMQDGDQQKCINTMNKDGLKVAQNQTKGARKCFKDAGKAGNGAGTQTCMEGDAKTGEARNKTTADEGAACTTPPDFGKTDDDDVNDAAESQSQRIFNDLYGGTLDPAVISCAADPDGKTDCKCQDTVNKDIAKLVKTQLKVYNKCKKDGLKTSINAASGLEACLDTADTDAKTTGAVSKMGSDITGKCTSPTAVSTLFPGVCAGETTGTLGACIDDLVDCRLCQMVNDMDDLNKDCDLYDDGLANDSCSEIECTLASTSKIDVNTQGFEPLLTLSPISGSIGIDCSGQDTNGDKTCTCGVNSFDPINVPAVGTVCLSPGTGSCTSGKLDCNGGSAADLDMWSDGNIGNCAQNASPDGNPDCATSCATFCAALSPPHAVFGSGCTGRCSGGGNENGVCTMDSECPGGACNGPEPVGGGQSDFCQCHCKALGIGADAGAGSLACELSTALVLESAAPCDGTDVVNALGDLCVPLTSATATGRIVDANFDVATIPVTPPSSNTGVATACDSAKAPKLRGIANFFGANPLAGDFHTELFLDCR